MNTKMIGAVAALLSAGAFAGTSHETALVTESRAIYEVVKISPPPPPQEQCWEEETVLDRHENGKRSGTPVIVSTIFGGAIGNAVGHNKSNQRVGAVLGAVLGHSTGRDIMRSNESPSSRKYLTGQRCETVYQQH
jgi:uncharacterized protein YcfJ